ncbi:MAG: CFI-box-CTERM domain-containing protein [Gammaproteobacteria bacterium]
MLPLSAIATSGAGQQSGEDLNNGDPSVASVGPSTNTHPAGEYIPIPGPDPSTLQEAIARIKALEKAGRSRSDIAMWLSGVLDRRVVNMNSLERMQHLESWRPWPLTEILPAPKQEAFDQWNARAEYRPEPTAQWTWENRIGQCSELAGTAYYILQQAGVSGNVRIVSAPNHEFVVWGERDGAITNDPSTWGANAFVVDGWMGHSFTPEQVQVNSYFKAANLDKTLTDVTTSFDKQAKRWLEAGVNKQSNGDSGDCFVVTATFGSPLAAEVQLFRRFRDHWLRKSETGRAMIDWYEKAGPNLARWIKRSPKARQFTRSFLIGPAAGMVRYSQALWDVEREEPLL